MPSPDDGALLDRALDAFASRGYDAMSVRELARDLDVSHNFVHQRFGSKERLWYAAVDRGFSRLAIDLISEPEEPSDPDGAAATDLERLRAMVLRYVVSMASHPALLRVIATEAALPGPRLDHLYERYIDPVRVFGQDLLDRLHEAGQVRTASVGLLFFLMTYGAAGSTALPELGARFGAEGVSTDPDVARRRAEEAVAVIFDGLALE